VRNFFKVAEGVDVVPLLHALHLNPDLWDQNTLRTLYPNSPHAQVSDIWVFFNEIDPENLIATADAIQTHPFEAWRRLPPLRPIIFDLMRRVEGVQLGRVLITRLPPGGQITPHKDEGAPVDFYTRYQVSLQSLPGCLFRAGDETVQMRAGDVWRFNNKQEHSVVNNSADDRLALIVDIRTA
jgi:hypothetical protein